MTSKPTARERFEEQKEIYRRYIEDGERNRIDGGFLLSLVEAAVNVAWDPKNKTTGEIWEMINQRMAEGEGKK